MTASPFPGMDPYLENPALWPGLHALLISSVAMALGPQVAPRYYVAVEQRTYIVAAEPPTFIGRPDIAVIGLPPAPSQLPTGAAAAAAPERPVTIELPLPDPVRERYLEIRDVVTHEVITVLEILSPTNKQPGPGRRQYERKRRQVLHTPTNLVEIDPLRAWDPMPMGTIPASHYRILVSRGWERPQAHLYPFNLNEPIPEVPIPLRPDDEEPTLALGELLTQVYERMRYDLRIDYTQEPVPPLDPALAAWSHELLCQAGLRQPPPQAERQPNPRGG